MNKETFPIKKLPAANIWATGLIMLGMASLLLYLVFTLVLVKIPGDIKYLPAGIVFLIILTSLFNFFRAVNEKILLDQTKLHYNRLFKKSSFNLSDITRVEVIKNLSSGLKVRNIIFRMIADALMGNYQLRITLNQGGEIMIPTVAGGGNLISPNIGFTKTYAEAAKRNIDNYKPTATIEQNL